MMCRMRLYTVVIRVYDEAGNVIETHEQAGKFKECYASPSSAGESRIGPKVGLAILQRFGANCLYVARNRLQNVV